MFAVTTSIKKLAKLSKPIRVVQGGTSAGKTHGIIPILINEAASKPRLDITIVAESIPAVKDGALKIFEDVMTETNRWHEDRFNKTERVYTFANKSKIKFTSFDSLGKAKAAGKRDILFINEANHIPYEVADALMTRSQITWIDYNPDAAFWVHNEVLKQHNSEFLLLKYTDNEAIPANLLENILIKINKAFHDVNRDWNDNRNIKSAYWRNWVKVYVEGEVGSVQGTIFEFDTIDDIPAEAQLIGYGLDFGFSNDPTALIEVRRIGQTLYLTEKIYQTGLLNNQIAERIKTLNIDANKPIVCDSAEPKSIQELAFFGVRNCIPVIKKDTLKSIDTLQQFKLMVHSSSLNLIKELRHYTWASDKQGNKLNEPIDAYNHLIDALRYFALNKLNNGSGHYSTLKVGKWS